MPQKFCTRTTDGNSPPPLHTHTKTAHNSGLRPAKQSKEVRWLDCFLPAACGGVVAAPHAFSGGVERLSAFDLHAGGGSAVGGAGGGAEGQLPAKIWRKLTLALWYCMERIELKIGLAPPPPQLEHQFRQERRQRGGGEGITPPARPTPPPPPARPRSATSLPSPQPPPP